jgi:WD40 repeat protein
VALLGLIAVVMLVRSELRLRKYASTTSSRNEQLKATVNQLNRSVTGSRLRALQSTMQTARSVAYNELENVQSFPPENRRFAWRLLHRLAYDEVVDLTDIGGIHRLWFSPDDRRLVVGSKPHFLSIVDLSRHERIDVPDTMKIVGPALFPPGSQSFYGQLRDGDLLEVSLESGKVLRRLSLPMTVRSRMVLTSDGRSIAGLTMDGRAFVYQISSGDLQVSDETMPAQPAGLWLTPDDRVLHTVNRRGDWYQWLLDDLSFLSMTPLKDVNMADSPVRAVEATYDILGGFCIATALESGICFAVWPENENMIHVLARSSPATSHLSFRRPWFCLCPDHEGGLLFSLTDPREQQRLRPPTDGILATAVSHDNHWIATGGSHGALTLTNSPNPGHSLSQTSLSAFANWTDLGYGPPVCTVLLGNTGNLLICHREGWMATMDAANSKTVEAFQAAESRFSVTAFSEKHQLAVFGFQMPEGCVVAHRYRNDGTFCEPVSVLPPDSDTRTEPIVAPEDQEFPIRPAPACVFRTDFKAHVSSLCFSHDEQSLIVGLRNGELLRLDGETGCKQSLICFRT